MNQNKEIIQKIMQKTEFSRLPVKDVELAFSKFERRQTSEEEKIRLTRELLHKVFGAFGSRKLLTGKNFDREPIWILNKHLSTRERIPMYKEIYKRILKNTPKNISVIDLGAGINGLSYSYFIKAGKKVRYSGVEAVGQIVDLTNNYFKKQKINAKLVHGSLFDLDTVKTMIKKMPNPKVIFLFKTIDSLEMMQKDYSKKLLLELAPLSEKIVVSFATESFNKRTRFKVKRYWILSFIEENFKITDSFELGGEMYIVFENKK